jgi:hypothetical protein
LDTAQYGYDQQVAENAVLKKKNKRLKEYSGVVTGIAVLAVGAFIAK